MSSNDGDADFSTMRNRVGAFQGQPAPAPDTSWAVPGETPTNGPEVVPGPGELGYPCKDES